MVKVKAEYPHHSGDIRGKKGRKIPWLFQCYSPATENDAENLFQMPLREQLHSFVRISSHSLIN